MFDYYKIIKIFDEDFDEDKHPRDKSGKFVKKSKESQKGHNVIKNKKYSSEMVDPYYIKPINDITNKNKYNALLYEFKNNGYNGRPILAIETSKGEYEALTGSHRILAAKKAGIKIPVKVVEYKKGMQELLDANDDDEREKILKDLYKKRKIDKESLDLFIEEQNRNYDDIESKKLEKEYVKKSNKLKEQENEEKEAIKNKNNKENDKKYEKEMKEYKNFYKDMVEKYGEEKMYSEMTDPEIDKLFLLESKAYGKY